MRSGFGLDVSASVQGMSSLSSLLSPAWRKQKREKRGGKEIPILLAHSCSPTLRPTRRASRPSYTPAILYSTSLWYRKKQLLAKSSSSTQRSDRSLFTSSAGMACFPPQVRPYFCHLRAQMIPLIRLDWFTVEGG